VFDLRDTICVCVVLGGCVVAALRNDCASSAERNGSVFVGVSHAFFIGRKEGFDNLLLF